MFDTDLPDRIDVVTHDGEEFHDLPASVQGSTIVFHHTEIALQPGDAIACHRPAGEKQWYVVVDPGLTKGTGGTPEFYRAEVEVAVGVK